MLPRQTESRSSPRFVPKTLRGGQNRRLFTTTRTNLNDPAIRMRAAVYIEKTVNRYKGHPAQGAWLLMNELSKYDTEPATVRAFAAWLEKKYRTVNALNQSWFRKVKSSSELTLTPDQLTAAIMDGSIMRR